jgi:hypothetical protein
VVALRRAEAAALAAKLTQFYRLVQFPQPIENHGNPPCAHPAMVVETFLLTETFILGIQSDEYMFPRSVFFKRPFRKESERFRVLLP